MQLKQLFKRSRIFVVLWCAVIFLLSACATQPAEMPEGEEKLPGFLKGLLHGFIMLFSFIGSLFTDYEIYAYPNAGGWYNFGFLLGAMIFFGGGCGGAKSKFTCKDKED